MRDNTRIYPVRSRVLCKGQPGLIASGPLENADGSVSYYIKEDARTQRFLGIFNEKYLKPNVEKENKHYGKR